MEGIKGIMGNVRGAEAGGGGCLSVEIKNCS